MENSHTEFDALRAVPTRMLRDFRGLVERFSKADKQEDRETAADRMVEDWSELRDFVGRSPLAAAKLSVMDEMSARLRSAAASADAAERADAAASFASTFDRIARAAATIDTPLEPGARWRPDRPPLAPEEKDARLKKVQSVTKGTARNLADAVRKVVQARREEGVPLYSTYSSEARADYAAAVTDFSLGLTPMVPYSPPTTKQSAPWGVFRVRSTVPPAEAASRFSVSPPLPARSELLESKFTRIRLALLRPGANGANGAHHSGGPGDA